MAVGLAPLLLVCGPPREPAPPGDAPEGDGTGAPVGSTMAHDDPPPGSTSVPGDSTTHEPPAGDPTTAEPPDTPTHPIPPGMFADVTDEVGLVAPHVAGGGITGQAWGDFDRDGWLDLFVSGGKDENRLFRNRGNGTFVRVPLAPEVALPGPSKAGVTWADYDGDGWLDLYLAVLGPNVLFRNEPDGSGGAGRVLVPVEAGVEHDGHGRASAWGDYDGDGRLDLYVVNGGSHFDALYHGEPDGRFSDASQLVALPTAKPGYAATWTDYDDDGDVDLYVVSDHHAGNDLWRNDGPDPGGGWRFTNVSAESGAGLLVDAMGIAVGDYDEDGDLDLFTSDIDRTNLLRNDLDLGIAGFTEVAEQAGVSHDSANWGASWLDADLDGWLDLYLATQNAGPPERTNRLFRNLGDGTFEDVSAACGCADPSFTTGVAAADYDGDGAVDLLVGDYGEGYRLYRNRLDPAAAGHHFLVVELVGSGSVNRDGLGARVTVTTSDGRRRVAERRSGSSLGAGDMLPLHFGLGRATVEAVEIRWPDGTVTRYRNVPTDTAWEAVHPG
jgi:enediyne biosynthesis protein E4